MKDNNQIVMTELDIQTVRQKIAEKIHEHMEISIENILTDIPFIELHKDFDSLTMLEVQLLLETEYGFEFEIDRHSMAAKIPSNATELAQELIKQHTRHCIKQQAKVDAAAMKQ